MPNYTIKDPQTNKTVTVSGDSPPTKAELEQIFAHVNGTAAPPVQSPLGNPELARVTGAGTAGADELARVAPIPGRAQYLPAAGAATLGTLASVASGGLAAPVAMALVGLAGAGGAGLGLAARDAMGESGPTGPSALSNVKDMAIQGAGQATGEGLGRGLVAGAQIGSRYLMTRAMNNAATRLAEEFSTMTQDMIDHAITVSKGGYEKARGLLKLAKASANAAVAKADAAGATIPVTTATNAMQGVLQRIANTGDVSGNLSALAKVEKQLTQGRGATLSIADADALKGELYSESKTLLQQIKQAGTRGIPQLKVEQEAKLAAAQALNDAIEQATTQAGAPGYRASNLAAQKMIGVNRGLKTAMKGVQNNYQALVRPGVGMLTGGALGETQGHPLAGAAIGATAFSPYGLSREAILLAHPAVQALLKQMPRAMSTAIASYFSQPESGEQPAGQ